MICLYILDRIEPRVKWDGAGTIQPIAPAPESNLDFDKRKKELEKKLNKDRLVDFYA